MADANELRNMEHKWRNRKFVCAEDVEKKVLADIKQGEDMPSK